MRIVSLAVLAACLSTTALAADLDYAPLRGTQYGSAAEPIVQWGGGYIGGFVGYGTANFGLNRPVQNRLDHEFRESVLNDSLFRISDLSGLIDGDSTSVVFGAFAGYQVQYDEFVFGIEVDYTRGKFSAQSSDSIGRVAATNGGSYTIYINSDGRAELNEFGTLRARVGYTMGSFLPFVTAGVALGKADMGYDSRLLILPPGSEEFIPYRLVQDKKDAYSLGFAAGAGVDVALTQNVFLRGEWQYLNFRDFKATSLAANTFRAAAGVKF